MNRMFLIDYRNKKVFDLIEETGDIIVHLLDNDPCFTQECVLLDIKNLLLNNDFEAIILLLKHYCFKKSYLEITIREL